MTGIERRILDAVITMVHVRKWTPKVLFLSPDDYADWLKARQGRDLHEVGGIVVKAGSNSRLYATHGYSGVKIRAAA